MNDKKKKYKIKKIERTNKKKNIKKDLFSLKWQALMICSYDLQLHGGSSLGIATLSSPVGIKIFSEIAKADDERAAEHSLHWKTDVEEFSTAWRRRVRKDEEKRWAK